MRCTSEAAIFYKKMMSDLLYSNHRMVAIDVDELRWTSSFSGKFKYVTDADGNLHRVWEREF